MSRFYRRHETEVATEPAPSIAASRPGILYGKSLGALGLPDFLNQRRDDFEQIPDDSVVGDLENRSVGVLIDRDDGFRALHADQVLYSSGNSDGHVDLRRDGLS